MHRNGFKTVIGFTRIVHIEFDVLALCAFQTFDARFGIDFFLWFDINRA